MRTVKLIVVAWLAAAAAAIAPAGTARPEPEPFNINLPLGVPRDVWEYYVPRDNPMTAAKVELGRRLFSDPRLSAAGTVSCATCHDPKRAFTDGRAVAQGVGGRLGTRNSPTLLNAMFNSGQFWDGRAATLEEQAIQPLVNPDEMGNPSYESAVARLRAAPEYAQAFRDVFGGAVTIEGVGRALAAFERTLVSGNAPIDRFAAGDAQALGEAARRGLALFRGKARCAVCHTFNQASPFFTDQNYRNTGVAANHPAFAALAQRAFETARSKDPRAAIRALAARPGGGELGRFLVTGNGLDVGAFRTPSLRDVELTAPYFHDGSARTLADVVRFYVQGGQHNPGLAWELQPLDLDEGEQADLVAFLNSLTGDAARRL